MKKKEKTFAHNLVNLITVPIFKISKYLQFLDYMHAYLHIVAIISLIT